MIYISHLVLDDDMKALVKEYGTGIESIDFSISDNLDQLSDSIKTYWEKMKEIGTRDLILHGPFLDVNPCAYDSMVREATMTRFNQCYEAGLHLGAKKIVFHSGMNPYVYYKEYWAEQVAKFWQEFMQNKTGLEIVLENVSRENHMHEEDLTLIQGIIDVFWIEDDGITVLDYKTDRVDTAQELIDRYATQLKLYADALERVFAARKLKVKEILIYSFSLEQLITL